MPYIFHSPPYQTKPTKPTKQGVETGIGDGETCRTAISTHSPQLDSLVRSGTKHITPIAINRIAQV